MWRRAASSALASRASVPEIGRSQVWHRRCFAAVAAGVPRKPEQKRRQLLTDRRPLYTGSTQQETSRETLFVSTSDAHEDLDSIPDVRAIEDAPADVLGFGDISPDTIRSIVKEGVPGWNQVPSEQINIDQLCEGLSNQNFKVHLDPDKAQPGLTPCVLFRVYGKDAGTLYDLAGELEVCKMLASYQVGPVIYASGEGWRIEEWHFSVPLPNRKMRNPSIFAQVASHLGRLHKLSARSDFPETMQKKPPLSMERLQTWADGSREAASNMTHPASLTAMKALNLEEVLAEQEWISNFIIADDPKIHGSGLDVVFSHWDSQENNILQTQYGLRFIDFEYSGMEYQAFDIATYFVETTIDYLHTKHPFFKVSLSDFPKNEEMHLFCSIYLSEYLETDVRPDDLAVLVLTERVKRFTLLVQYIWSLWSVIRAPQAPTFNDFDYLQFAQTRWFMYKWAKRAVLAEQPSFKSGA